MMRRSGFTLIELLVVIAIIAILAAILFPVFTSAKRRVQASACVSNQKQIAAAYLSYMTDWNDRSCNAYQGNDWSSSGLSQDRSFWGQVLRPYSGKNVFVTECPGIKKVSGRGENSYNNYWNTTIGMNLALGCITMNQTAQAGEVVKPSQTIAFGCSSLYAYSEGSKYGHWAICPGSKTEPRLCLAKGSNPGGHWTSNFFDPNRHDGKVVITFFDGHVTLCDIKKLLTPVGVRWRDPNYSMWDIGAGGR